MLALLAPAGCRPARKQITVFAASSLARAFSDLKATVEAEHRDLDIRLSISGSQEACRKVAELGHRADVVATADDRVIDQILRPQHCPFTIQFASNEVVLAHLEHSKHTEEITASSWPSILLRPEVRLGMASPDLAPIGYATVLVWQLTELTEGRDRVGPDLAGRLRAHCRREHVTSDEGALLQLLQARAIDYAFVYRSSAEEHNLKLVELPDAVNLGATGQAASYARVSVEVRMRSGEAPKLIRGRPILYGVTIPGSAPEPAGAALFLRYLLGEPGRRTLQRSGFRPLAPALCRDRAALPEALSDLTR